MNNPKKTIVPFEPADRYCTLCRVRRASKGGYWKTYNNGRNRRWFCAKHKTSDHSAMSSANT